MRPASTLTSPSLKTVTPHIAEALVATVGLLAAILAVCLQLAQRTFGPWRWILSTSRRTPEHPSSPLLLRRSDGDGQGQRRGRLAEINVTPLVDVMLVLLIILWFAGAKW